MKILLLLLLSCFSLNYGQNHTLKFNVRLNRIEYYDGKTFLYYSKENNKYLILEFYDTTDVLFKIERQHEDLKYRRGLENIHSVIGVKMWNPFKKRYEVYDSLGIVTGYFKLDDYVKRWEYTKGEQ